MLPDQAADFHRIGWPGSTGIGGRLPTGISGRNGPEYAGYEIVLKDYIPFPTKKEITGEKIGAAKGSGKGTNLAGSLPAVVPSPSGMLSGSSGIRPGGAPLTVFSIPDRMDVYVTSDASPEEVFTDRNRVGIAPTALTLSPGEYWVGILTKNLPGKTEFLSKPKGVDFVMRAEKGAVMIGGDPNAVLEGLTLSPISPKRTTITAEESEPYVCDLGVGLRGSRPPDQSSDLSSLYYRKRQGKIEAVGAA